ncbi:COP9 signalosome (CSN) subunit [Linnemannia exigua]|uniref:Protein CSN12 homolog n=1 Tax=Linnemannia exigua TaxID=604196 RepID=A0AAD4DFA5_9FUNG|nr:COP9 signalosome (CSN) subunit [Linnemannia exigua]
MILPMYLGQVNQGINHEHAQKVAAFLQVFSKHSEKLLMESKESVREIEETCRARLQSPWNDIVFHHIMACKGVEAVDFVSAYGDQLMAVTIFLREFPSMTNWPLEILYILNADLGRLAVQADKQLERRGEKPSKLEDCARAINKAFSICITDRSPLNISRKWGTYNIIGILFRTYFKLKSHNLCKNILRAVKAADLPELEQFPMAHQVTIRYYTGVLSFFNDDFKKAESDLQFAFDHIPPKFHHNRRLVLHYLIPTRLLHGSLPSSRLLEEFSELSILYRPLALAIKTGNVQLFDEALSMGGSRLIGLGTYLTVERSRGVAVRVLFKKVFLLSDKSNKLNIEQFQRALAFAGVHIDEEEVECMLANMIYKGYIRGYLSHEKKVLVLSQKDPFPGLESLQ